MENIKTDRLLLRRPTEGDIAQYIEIMTKPEVTRYLGSGTPLPRERADEGVGRLLAMFESAWDGGHGVFAVVESASSKIIGYCGIRPIPDGRIEILYGYDPSAWGKGYATEAGKAVLVYGKENFGITELIAMSYPQNKGSIAVIEKLGFERVGEEEHFGKMLEVFVLKF